jgi:NAD(P)-dependent dehydrogenase (short-subunit alcohol dehydrogenase family)
VAVPFSPRVRRVTPGVSSGAGSHGDEQFGLARRGRAAASYGISKAAQNALISTLAAELADTPILVNAACPGLTATWPGAEQMGARPMADGAASIVWAAMIPDDGPNDGLFRDGQPLAW